MQFKRSCIITIGNELINGERVDTNSNYIQLQLRDFLIKVTKVIVLPDDMDFLVREFSNSILDFDFVFITGGLGPTEDDLTRFALSKAFGLELLFDKDEFVILKKKYDNLHKVMNINNHKQCLFPRGSSVISNSIGTASGFYFKKDNSFIFVLPGVPSEIDFMFDSFILTFISAYVKKLERGVDKLIVKTMGIAESSLDDIVLEKISKNYDITFETRITNQGVFLKLYPKSPSLGLISDLKISLENNLRDFIYAYGDDNLLDIVLEKLNILGLNICVIESCTGGMLAKLFTDRPGSSSYFKGGVVCYSNDFKNILGVPNEKINEYGAVSMQVAEIMSVNGRKLIGADISISITGIAGPGGATENKPVGIVYFSIADKNKTLVKNYVFNGSRDDIRNKSCYFAINFLRLFLNSLS